MSASRTPSAPSSAPGAVSGWCCPTPPLHLLVLRPLGGTDDDIAGVLPGSGDRGPRRVRLARAGRPGRPGAAGLLRTALRIGFRAGAGPVPLARVDRRRARAPYQLVPLLMALRQDTVRLLIADDVGIGKTIEAGLIAAELLAQGDARGLVVLCSPALAEQWQARAARASSASTPSWCCPRPSARLSAALMLGRVALPTRTALHRGVHRLHQVAPAPRRLLCHCPDLVIVDEAHTCVADAPAGPEARTSQQRYELLRTLAADASPAPAPGHRHTALRQGGAFRNLLGLLDPELATVDLDTEAGRATLAEHFVQRRRADIRHYLGEDTALPIRPRVRGGRLQPVTRLRERCSTRSSPTPGRP